MNGPFVLDASMTLSWAFAAESTPLTISVLRSLEIVHAFVPALWPFEIANVPRTAERRGRMDAKAQVAFLERLRLLPIEIERRPAVWLAQQILPLARVYQLSGTMPLTSNSQCGRGYRSPPLTTISARRLMLPG